MKEGRRRAEGDGTDEVRRREQAVLAEERPKLVDRHKEGDEVDDAERAFEDETGQPVIGCREPVHGGGYATRAVDPAGSTTRALAEARSEEHTSELQSHHELVCRLLLE